MAQLVKLTDKITLPSKVGILLDKVPDSPWWNVKCPHNINLRYCLAKDEFEVIADEAETATLFRILGDYLSK